MAGGVVKVADAPDMERGRSRIPYEAGRINIHPVFLCPDEEEWNRKIKDLVLACKGSER